MVIDGYLDEKDRLGAIEEYRRWIETEALEQELYLVGVVGKK